MKNLSLKIQHADKVITAICPTPEGVEWTTLKITGEGPEAPTHDQELLPDSSLSTEGILTLENLPDRLRHSLAGDIIYALPSRSMCFETASFPTTDAEELLHMSQFQLDKKIPFPIDRMTCDCELLQQNDQESTVLMGSAQQAIIEQLSCYSSKQLNLTTVDSRICGWLLLIPLPENATHAAQECLLIDDGFETHLVLRKNGLVQWIRPLYITLTDPDAAQEMAYELTYSQQSHETEIPETLHLWTHQPLARDVQEKLEDQLQRKLSTHDLSSLSPLSTGLIKRSLENEHTLNFLPTHWREKQQQRVIYKTLKKSMGLIAAVWALLFAIFILLYVVRSSQLNQIAAEADSIAPAAQKARENSEKLDALKLYTDRSLSSLECLRELTLLLPAGDIEFTSYNYSKTKGISLRGTAINDDIVYEFFKKMAASDLFSELKNQSVNNRTSKGIQRTVFSVSLNLNANGEST